MSFNVENEIKLYDDVDHAAVVVVAVHNQANVTTTLDMIASLLFLLCFWFLVASFEKRQHEHKHS